MKAAMDEAKAAAEAAYTAQPLSSVHDPGSGRRLGRSPGRDQCGPVLPAGLRGGRCHRYQ